MLILSQKLEKWKDLPEMFEIVGFSSPSRAVCKIFIHQRVILIGLFTIFFLSIFF